MSMTLLGIDTGGTFTDFVALTRDSLEVNNLKVHKVLSTPSAPEQAILQGIEEMQLSEVLTSGELIVIHGTTVATNAVLEYKGVRTVYITNQGLKDVLRLGRQTRSELYDLNPPEPISLFNDELMLEVSARTAANGEPLSFFKPNELTTLKNKVDALNPEAIAINLLFSFLSSKDEEELAALFSKDYFVSRSSLILPEIQEYERGMTTWINAWIGPLIKSYISNLETKLKPSVVSIMQSSGLTIAAPLAADRAVNLLLSGPAGGLAAAQHIGRLTGQENLMTFDMGGTSTDVALIEGQFKITNHGKIAGLPVSVPMADIHTIGAGGGSIAYIDSGGLLKVGPESAGASPGPACYNLGGNRPTVTDANLILGRLGKGELAGGLVPSLKKSMVAMNTLASVLNTSIEMIATGILQLANEHMTQALRVISIERGHDPRDFVLMCFGGAGGLHLCDLAESLEIKTAMVPIHGGVLSAMGLIASKPGREVVKTKQIVLDALDPASLDLFFGQLEKEALKELESEQVEKTLSQKSLDLRYLGQTYTINVPYQAHDDPILDGQTLAKQRLAASEKAFHQAHEDQYGHRMDRPVELLNYRLHIESLQDDLKLPPYSSTSHDIKEKTTIDGLVEPVDIIRRESIKINTTLKGPLLITESHATTYIKPDWQIWVDEIGNLRLEFQC